MIDSDMRAVVEAAHLCFAATVTPEGRPNLSPKGTIRVWDDTHLFFLDVASPGTRANLTHSPWMEINVVEQLSRRGYRFSGQAALHLSGSAFYDQGIRRVYGETPAPMPVAAVVLLAVERAAAAALSRLLAGRRRDGRSRHLTDATRQARARVRGSRRARWSGPKIRVGGSRWVTAGRSRVGRFAIVWGVVIAALGFSQQRLLVGDLHWIIRVLHLVVGMAAMPIAERLARPRPESVT